MACCGSRPRKGGKQLVAPSPRPAPEPAPPPLQTPVVVIAAAVPYPGPEAGGGTRLLKTQIRQLPSRFTRPVPMAVLAKQLSGEVELPAAPVMDAKGVAEAMLAAPHQLAAPGEEPPVEPYPAGTVLAVLEQANDVPNQVPLPSRRNPTSALAV